MANGRSQIGTAQEKTLSVAANLDEAKDTHLPEYKQHFENRKEEVEALYADTHQSDAKELITLLDTAIDAINKVIEQLGDGADKARAIEARL
ncbi:MAG: hypothetical protein JOY78_14430 [Pseudonocardia sp.]|nr:hypothetical protein [Pseudonocardia sp.]